MAERTLRRVELHWDDGSVMIAAAEEAEKWQRATTGQAQFCLVHNVPFPAIDWVRFGPSDTSSKEQEG